MLIWPKILLTLHPSVWNLGTHITKQYIVESIPHGLIVVESVEKKEKRKRAKRKDVLCFVSLFYHCTAFISSCTDTEVSFKSSWIPKIFLNNIFFFHFFFSMSNEPGKKELSFWKMFMLSHTSFHFVIEKLSFMYFMASLLRMVSISKVPGLESIKYLHFSTVSCFGKIHKKWPFFPEIGSIKIRLFQG